MECGYRQSTLTSADVPDSFMQLESLSVALWGQQHILMTVCEFVKPSMGLVMFSGDLVLISNCSWMFMVHRHSTCYTAPEKHFKARTIQRMVY